MGRGCMYIYRCMGRLLIFMVFMFCWVNIPYMPYMHPMGLRDFSGKGYKQIQTKNRPTPKSLFMLQGHVSFYSIPVSYFCFQRYLSLVVMAEFTL